MTILGLDVSTSYVGWTVLDAGDKTPVAMGYIDLTKAKDLISKSHIVRSGLREIHNKWKIKRVFVEEDLQKFRKGMSSAATIQKLSRFNGMTCLLAWEVTGITPTYVNVISARKKVGCKFDRADKSKTTKEKVFEWVQSQFEFDWPTKVLASGPRKGAVVFESGCFDMADSYVVALSGPSLVP